MQKNKREPWNASGLYPILVLAIIAKVFAAIFCFFSIFTDLIFESLSVSINTSSSKMLPSEFLSK